jgi:hypothetical protein
MVSSARQTPPSIRPHGDARAMSLVTSGTFFAKDNGMAQITFSDNALGNGDNSGLGPPFASNNSPPTRTRRSSLQQALAGQPKKPASADAFNGL